MVLHLKLNLYYVCDNYEFQGALKLIWILGFKAIETYSLSYGSNL